MTPTVISPGDAQFVASALAVLGIERAKSEQGIGKYLPLIRKETDKLNRFVGVAISLAGSAGIAISFHAGTLTITNLTWTTFLTVVVFCGRSLAGQELIYRLVKMSGHLSELAETFAVLSSSAPHGGDPSAGDPRESWEDVEKRLAAEHPAPKQPESK